MRVKTKIILILFLAGFLRSGQACAQSDAIQTLRRQFETSSTQGLREKLYVQTDKNFYTPGEVIWFKVYAVDGIFNKPLDLSKATYVEIDGEGREIFKSPVTDDGTKNSASGLLCVKKENGKYELYDKVGWEEEKESELRTVFKDGILIKEYSLKEIRKTLRDSIAEKQIAPADPAVKA